MSVIRDRYYKGYVLHTTIHVNTSFSIYLSGTTSYDKKQEQITLQLL